MKPVDNVYVAVRGDRFYEHLATDWGGRSSAPIFCGGVEWVSSGTATLEVRPHDPILAPARVPPRRRGGPALLRPQRAGDGTAQAPYVANARTQDTILLGATAWF